MKQKENRDLYEILGDKFMGTVKWTNEQLQAIEEKGSNILVAAAARKRKNSSFGRKNY